MSRGGWLVPVGALGVIAVLSSLSLTGKDSANSPTSTPKSADTELDCPSGDDLVTAETAAAPAGTGSATRDGAVAAALEEVFVGVDPGDVRLRTDSATEATAFLFETESRRAQIDVEQSDGRWHATRYQACSSFAQDHIRR